MSERVHQTLEHAKTVGDLVSAGVVVAAILQWLPAVAALLTIVWTAIRIYETDTVQRLVAGRRKPAK